ncbi:coiled-coil domain-containing protein 38-like [Sebastes fasciatus]|uniref:coiled-coil domain-containing protein 38-like n=1 Tax=Sebastes fasciatus TaxID=394691 RepID=UPI003D9DC374
MPTPISERYQMTMPISERYQMTMPELRGKEKGHSMSTVTVKEKGAVCGKKDYMRILQLYKSALQPQTQDVTPDLKMPLMKRKTVYNSSSRDNDLERTKQVAIQKEISMSKTRSEIMEMDKAIAAKRQHVNTLEQIHEAEKNSYEEKLKMLESMDDRKHFERDSKSKQGLQVAKEKLIGEIGTMKSELAKNEDILEKCKWYKNILFKMSPPEWQEAKKANALNAKVLSGRKAQDEQNREPQRGLESSPDTRTSTRDPTLSSAHDTLVTHSKLDSVSSESEERLELYFSDAEQILNGIRKFEQEVWTLNQHTTKFDDVLDIRRRTIEATLLKLKEQDEMLTLQVSDMKDNIDREKKRGAMLKEWVQLYDSTSDEDTTRDVLSAKVAEVYRCCVDSCFPLFIRQNMIGIEAYVASLETQLGSIPTEQLKKLKRAQRNDRMKKLNEENMKMLQDKQEERNEKCRQRALAVTKKLSVRKLMTRQKPFEKRVEPKIFSDVDEFCASLFTKGVDSMASFCQPKDKTNTGQDSLHEFSRAEDKLEYSERKKLQLPYRKINKFKLTLAPPVSTKEAPVGLPCLPAGVEASPYHDEGTGESLPRNGTGQIRAIKPYLEHNKVQLTCKDKSKIDLQPTHLAPISTKGSGQTWATEPYLGNNELLRFLSPYI